MDGILFHEENILAYLLHKISLFIACSFHSNQLAVGNIIAVHVQNMFS